MKLVFSHLAALYLGAGIFSALLMNAALPGLNTLGMTYIAITWPKMVYCARIDSGCDAGPPKAISSYIFSE